MVILPLETRDSMAQEEAEATAARMVTINPSPREHPAAVAIITGAPKLASRKTAQLPSLPAAALTGALAATPAPWPGAQQVATAIPTTPTPTVAPAVAKVSIRPHQSSAASAASAATSALVTVTSAPNPLGALKKRYAGATGAQTTVAVFCTLGMLAALYANAVTDQQEPAWIFIAGLLILFAMANWIGVMSRSFASVEIYDRGAIIKRGDRETLLTFSEIGYVWYLEPYSGTGIPIARRFTAELLSGKRIKIDAAVYRDQYDLAEQLTTRLTASLTARLLREIRAGKQVAFGHILVDQAGVSYKRDTLPWREVQEIRINKGVLEINRRSKLPMRVHWAQVPAERAPNAFALLMVAKALRPSRLP
jgi:hypothetical protein